MKATLLSACCLLALACGTGVAPAASRVHAEITLAPLGRHHGSPPPLGRRQGWLTISNRDWQPYTLAANHKERLFLYRAGSGGGGILIPSGTTVTIALEKGTYDLYGSTSDKIKVKIREGRTSTLSLEPFGYANSPGLRGVVNDGDKVRTGTLFDPYITTVVRPGPPVVVAPPPPSVIVAPPPVVIRPPAHRPPPPRPGPGHRPGPGGHGGKNDGWGFVIGFGKR
ncbi:MAG: hypothetical protein LIP77_08650 [Planctomycetes bacterium]|nr:hypothetical protein [Planctomycetota bacterium]